MKRTPLSRKTPLHRGDAGLSRRTPLQQGSELARRTPLKPQSAKRRREMRERRAMVAALWPERPKCAVPWCGRLADDVHEPLMRSRGGSITDPENAVPLCRPCHMVISDEQPRWAYELGLLRHSWDARRGSKVA